MILRDATELSVRCRRGDRNHPHGRSTPNTSRTSSSQPNYKSSMSHLTQGSKGIKQSPAIARPSSTSCGGGSGSVVWSSWPYLMSIGVGIRRRMRGSALTIDDSAKLTVCIHLDLDRRHGSREGPTDPGGGLPKDRPRSRQGQARRGGCHRRKRVGDRRWI